MFMGPERVLKSGLYKNGCNKGRGFIIYSGSIDDEISTRKIRKRCKLKSGSVSSFVKPRTFYSNSSCWIKGNLQTSAFEVEVGVVDQVDRPLTLEYFQDNCGSMVVESVKQRNVRRRVQTGVDNYIDEKRRKLDDHPQIHTMEVVVNRGLCPSLDRNTKNTYGFTLDKELTSNTRKLVNNISDIIHSTSFNMVTPTITSKETTDIPLKDLFELRKRCKKKTIVDSQKGRKIMYNLGSLKRVINELLLKNLNSLSPVLSVYIPLTHEDTSYLHFNTSNGNRVSGILPGRIDYEPVCCNKKGTIRCGNVDNRVSFQQNKHFSDIVENCCDFEKIRLDSECGNLPRQIIEPRQFFLLILNKYLKLIYVSRNLWNLLGYKPEDMLGQCIETFIHPNNFSDMLDHSTQDCCQPDSDNSYPVWIQGKVLHFFLRPHCHKDDVSDKNTEYTMFWNVNVRLNRRKTQRHTDQDLIVLCSSVHADSAERISLGRDGFKCHHDLVSDLYDKDNRYVKAEKTVSIKRKALDQMKCSGFTLTSASFSVDCGGSVLQNLAKCKEQKMLDNNLYLEHILDSCHLNNHADSFDSCHLNNLADSLITSKQHQFTSATHSTTDRNHNKFRTINSSLTNNIQQENKICLHLSPEIANPVHHEDELCISNTLFKIKLNEKNPEYNNTDSRSSSGISFDNNKTSNHSKVHSNSIRKIIESNLTKHSSTSCSFSNSDFSNAINQCSSLVMFSNKQQETVNQLTNNKLYTSYNSENSCTDVVDFNSSESSVKSQFSIQSTKVFNETQSEKALKDINKSKFIQDISDSDNDLYLIDINRPQSNPNSIAYFTDDSTTDPIEDNLSDMNDDNLSTYTDISSSDFAEYSGRSDLTDNSLSDFTDIDNNRTDLVKNNISEKFILYDNCLANHLTLKQWQHSTENECKNYLKDRQGCFRHCNKDKSHNLNTGIISSVGYTDNILPSLITKNKETSLYTHNSDNNCTQNIHVEDKQPLAKNNYNLSKNKVVSHTSNIQQLNTSSCNLLNKHLSTCISSNSFLLSPVNKGQEILAPTFMLSTDHLVSMESNRTLQKNIIDNKVMPNIEDPNIFHPQHFDNINKVLSKMTKKNSDPFLSQARLNVGNTQPCLDVFDDFSVECSANSPLPSPVTLQHISSSDHEKLPLFIEHQPPNISLNFLESSESMTHVSFAPECLNELDSFLNTIPLSPCMTNINNLSTTQPLSVSESAEVEVIPNQDSEAVSNDSSDSDNSNKSSLLRKLLYKEGLAVQRPKTYTKWAPEQLPKKISHIRKVNKFNEIESTRPNSSFKRKKNAIKKTREFPMFYLSCGHMKFGRSGLQSQKATKELPLPFKAVGVVKSSAYTSQDVTEIAHFNHDDVSDKDTTSHIDTSGETSASIVSPLENAADLSLPEDLLDMAMEYCAPLDIGQAEAFISDLNGACSWEDNLYSLLENADQEKFSTTPNNKSTPQHQLGKSASLLTNTTLDKSIENINLAKSPTQYSISVNSNVQNNTEVVNNNTNTFSHSSSFNLTSKSQHSLHATPKNSISQADNSQLPTKTATDSININKRMSFLRAAIISPDVDKLIEQIPLSNVKKNECPSKPNSDQYENDQDVVITKVIGLQKSQVLPSVQTTYEKSNNALSSNALKSSENMSNCAIGISNSKSTYTIKSIKCMPNSANRINNSKSALEHKNTKSIRHVLTTCLSGNLNNTNQQKTHASCINSISPTEIHPHPVTNPLIIKISLDTNLAKIVNGDHFSQKRFTHKLKPSNQSLLDNTKQTQHKANEILSSTDLSSTHPVSVMVMRKENHRSRRSKSIAIQTDNSPGEVYPEFEHSPSDVILYPSVLVSYPTVISPRHDISPASDISPTSNSSQSSTSDIEKFLLSHSISDDSLSSIDNENQFRSGASFVNENNLIRSRSSSSTDDNHQVRSGSSFLFKLLTGELSKDHYQRLDQQLLEKERKKSIEL